MTREEAETVLAQAGQASEDAFPLFEAALACAVHEDPDRDLEAARAMAANAVARLAGRLTKESPEEAIAEAISGDLQLNGDLLTYEHPDNADIIALADRRRGLPVLLVARSGLGTLNHTLLSLEALAQRRIPVLGLVLNGPPHADNPRTLAALGGVPLLACLPPLAAINRQSLAALWQTSGLGDALVAAARDLLSQPDPNPMHR